MKILVTGGTGFTGKRVLPLLKNKGDISVFARKDSDVDLAKRLGFKICYGDIDSPETFESALSGCEGLINIMSIGFGHADTIVSIAENVAIRRALFVGTTAVFTTLPAKTKKVRLAAEESIKKSKLQWTLLRPTMIYGGQDDRNMSRLIQFVKKYPIIPVPGDGKSLMQPIHVEDLAKAIVDAFFSDKTIGKSYNLSGKSPLSFNEIIDEVSLAHGKRRIKVHLPMKFMRFGARCYERVSQRPRIKEEQLLRLNEDKAFDHKEAESDFSFYSRSYRDGISKDNSISNVSF